VVADDRVQVPVDSFQRLAESEPVSPFNPGIARVVGYQLALTALNISS
jgi:hypothetical protein